MIYITDISEYNYIVKQGFHPLADWRNFTIEFELRIQIQNDRFGNDFTKANQRFYEYCWLAYSHACEETGKPLHNYSSVYISHIISKGADRRMSIDPRNVNILSFEAHQKWEFGNKKEMAIYPINKIITNILKNEYNQRKTYNSLEI